MVSPILDNKPKAENEADSSNIYDQNYNNTFSPAKNLSDAEKDIVNDRLEDGFNQPAIKDEDRNTKKNTNYNSDSYVSDTDVIKDAEENPKSYYNETAKKGERLNFRGRLSKNMKNKSATGGIVGVILLSLIGVGGGTATLSSSLLVNVKEVLHSDRSDQTRTSLKMTRAMVAVALKSNKNNDPCTNKSSIACTLGTFAKERIDNFKSEGFKFEAKEVDANGNETGKTANDNDTAADGRYKLESVTFPDGHISTSGTDFNSHTDNSVDARRHLLAVGDGKADRYANSKKFLDTLVNKLKIKNGKTPTDYKEGEDANAQEERDKLFNSTTDGVSNADSDAEAKKIKDKALSDAEESSKKGGKSSKTGGVTAFIQAACSAYKTTKVATTTVKVAHMARLANFAMEFLKAADEIKAGVATGAAISYLADKLTYVERNEYLDNGEKNPKYNLSATDSQGYRIAAQGDGLGLAAFAERYTMGGANEGEADSTGTKVLLAGVTGVAALEVAMGGIANAIPGVDTNGKDVIKELCRAGSSTLVTLGQCGALLTQALGTVEVGIGLVTGAIGLTMCKCEFLPIPTPDCLAADAAISTIKKGLVAATAGAIGYLLEDIVKNWNIGSDTKGVDAGNAIAAGVGIILSSAATSYALKPATKTQYEHFVAETQPEVDKYDQVAVLNAKDQPFDLTNRYSFISRVATVIAGQGDVPESVSGYMLTNSLMSVIPTAVNSLGEKAYGLYSQPVQKQDGRYDCNTPTETRDDDLLYLGVDGDKLCEILTVTPDNELDKIDKQATDPDSEEFQKVREWMQTEQKKPISDGGTMDTGSDCIRGCNGEASIDDKGKPNENSQYTNWIEYCSDARVDPWGASTHAFEEGSDLDQDWFTGKQCLDENSTMMTYFRTWHRICSDLATQKATTYCYDDPTSVANTTPSNCASNGDTKAIYTCALQYDNYDYKWGGGHGDVPNAQAWIKDFKAGKYPQFTPILDCSGLVRMAFVEAMGIEDQAYTAPGGYDSSKYWQKIPLEQAQQGDIVTESGHVAIVESNDTGAKTFKIFDAETENAPNDNQIQHSTASYGKVIGAYRAKKVTAV